jgi:DNA transformation protein
MSVSDGYLTFVKDLLGDFGPVTARRMFSGAGLYESGVMFGLVIDDVLYLKADEAFAKKFVAEDMKPFSYTAAGKCVSTSYWRVPERLLEDPDDMRSWAEQALRVARTRAAKPRRKKEAVAT